jgi:gluconate kinase
MKIYFFFGRSGAGKSFLGNYLQEKYQFTHFDGDSILTKKMRELIIEEEKFTQEMVDEYNQNLIENIQQLYLTSNKNVVISQGLYRNKNRLEIHQQFPDIQWILIHADAPLCAERVAQRKNHVTAMYANKISHLFEPPQGFSYATFNNNSQDFLTLEAEIKNKLNTIKPSNL